MVEKTWMMQTVEIWNSEVCSKSGFSKDQWWWCFVVVGPGWALCPWSLGAASSEPQRCWAAAAALWLWRLSGYSTWPSGSECHIGSLGTPGLKEPALLGQSPFHRLSRSQLSWHRKGWKSHGSWKQGLGSAEGGMSEKQLFPKLEERSKGVELALWDSPTARNLCNPICTKPFPAFVSFLGETETISTSWKCLDIKLTLS